MKKFIKFFTLIFVLLMLIPSVYAAPVTKNRSNESNLGVNKKWKITNKNKSNVLNTPWVDASEKIYDFAEILSDEEETQLRSLANTFIQQYKTDLVIVTYSLPYSNDKQNEDFAADFYDYNDFGLTFENYSGVLLFRNTYSADPYYDMYTFGNAQLYFDQYRYDVILDGIYNNLHYGNYLAGFTEFINKTSYYFSMGRASYYKDYYIDENGALKKNFSPNILYMLLVGGVVTTIVMLILVKKNKMIVSATQATEYLDKDSFKITNQNDTLINTVITHHRIQSSSGGGGGHSSFGSSGGGHSSGGGRHG